MAAPVLYAQQAAPNGDEDQWALVRGVDWKTYCAVRELFDRPGVRLTYFKGTLEIMNPSRRHEGYKKRIARLIELYAFEREVALHGYGSTTFRRALEERGLEPDECYVLGRELSEDESPDIALEVVVSSGGINKLEVYRGLEVKEVWVWHRGAFQVYVLGADGYQVSSSSELLPDLDFARLALLAEEPDQLKALKRFQRELRGA
jgi:Uma2 family endonuclease